MTEKTKKPASSANTQPSVLGSLSSTRPERLGRRPTAPKKPAPAAKAPPARKRQAPPRRPAPPPPPPEPPRRSGPPSGGELVTTAVQAVGELAQIGLGAGARVLRRAARRVPRP